MKAFVTVAVALGVFASHLNDADAHATRSTSHRKHSMPQLSSRYLAPQSPRYYNEIYEWCSSAVSEINIAMARADQLFGAGETVQAVRVLRQAFANAATGSGNYPFYPQPHTYATIVEGWHVAEAMRQASGGASDLDEITRAQVQFMFLAGLVKVVNYAYQEIDSSYYMSVANICRVHSCYRWGGDDEGPLYGEEFYENYFNGFKNLAKEFLELQLATGPAQASNRIELNVAFAVAQSAVNLLNSSVFRREAACAILDLYDLKDWIASTGGGCRARAPKFTRSGGPSLDDPTLPGGHETGSFECLDARSQMEYVREAMARINDSLEDRSCGFFHRDRDDERRRDDDDGYRDDDDHHRHRSHGRYHDHDDRRDDDDSGGDDYED